MLGKMRDRITLKQRNEEGVTEKLGRQSEFKIIQENIPAQKYKLMDKESIALKSTENITRVNFIIRDNRKIDVDLYIECKGQLYNILGYENLRDHPQFLLVATQLVRE